MKQVSQQISKNKYIKFFNDITIKIGIKNKKAKFYSNSLVKETP